VGGKEDHQQKFLATAVVSTAGRPGVVQKEYGEQGLREGGWEGGREGRVGGTEEEEQENEHTAIYLTPLFETTKTRTPLSPSSLPSPPPPPPPPPCTMLRTSY